MMPTVIPPFYLFITNEITNDGKITNEKRVAFFNATL